MYLHLHPHPEVFTSLPSESSLRLTQQIITATRWLRAEMKTGKIPIGLFGAYQDAEIALSAAAFLGNEVAAVVAHQGHPDKAMNHLSEIKAPTLLLVNEGNDALFTANVQASWWLRCTQHVALIPGRPRLLSERCSFDTVNLLASNWYRHHFLKRTPLKAFPGQLLATARDSDWAQKTIYHQ
jgi:putative phosphoribosyl transferase